MGTRVLINGTWYNRCRTDSCAGGWRVVVVAEPVDIGPAVQRPVDLVGDAEGAEIIGNGAVDAVAQPGHGRVVGHEQIVAQVVGGEC
jgi:hypothetical protein